MKTLSLNLIKRWFNRHLEDKGDDYREITPYWCKRFLEKHDYEGWIPLSKEYINDLFEMPFPNAFIMDEIMHGNLRFKKFSSVTFSNGMTPPVPRFVKEFKEIKIGPGLPEWGAVVDKVYFIVKCGKVLSKENFKK